MPRIPNTPSVRTFTETWSTDFKDAVTKAAGKDGRLTMTEAQKLATRPDADKAFADNAINYLKATGKQSVSVDVLATSAKAYAQRAAEVALMDELGLFVDFTPEVNYGGTMDENGDPENNAQ